MAPSSSPPPPRTLLDAARSFFSLKSPQLLGLQLLAAIVVRPFLGRPALGEGLLVIGVALYWPLQEWILHKYVLHAPPLRLGTLIYESRAARSHKLHHDAPLNPKTTVLPQATVLILISIHLAVWWLVAPTTAFACTGVILLGFAALSYEWIHFLTHTAYRPRTKWFARVKRQHMAHHFRDSRRWFAFVLPQLDDWLGREDD